MGQRNVKGGYEITVNIVEEFKLLSAFFFDDGLVPAGYRNITEYLLLLNDDRRLKENPIKQFII